MPLCQPHSQPTYCTFHPLVLLGILGLPEVPGCTAEALAPPVAAQETKLTTGEHRKVNSLGAKLKPMENNRRSQKINLSPFLPPIDDLGQHVSIQLVWSVTSSAKHGLCFLLFIVKVGGWGEHSNVPPCICCPSFSIHTRYPHSHILGLHLPIKH